MREEIIVTVNKGGDIHTEVKGVKGKRCIEVTEFISALGESTRNIKREYFQCDKIRTSSQRILDKKFISTKDIA